MNDLRRKFLILAYLAFKAKYILIFQIGEDKNAVLRNACIFFLEI